MQEIHEVTKIPVAALRGGSLSRYTVDERISWAEQRKTTRDEDGAYSLQGLFDVQMPLLYGERRKKAFFRLHREIKLAIADDPLLGMSTEEGSANASSPAQSLERNSEDVGEASDVHPMILEQQEQHSHWNEAVAQYMNLPDGYSKVAVGLIKWIDELDDLRTHEKVCRLFP